MTGDLLYKPGIYCIYFSEEPNLLYIGCSTSVRNRISDHTSDLNRNVHSNYKLQSLYNKYHKFCVEILEYCTLEELFEKEKAYIREFNSTVTGLNLTYGGEGKAFGELNGSAKYSEKEYVETLRLIAETDLTYREIADRVGVSRDLVKKIGGTRAHTYLQDKYPELYKKVQEKYLKRDNSAKSQGVTYPRIKSPTGEYYSVDNVHKFAQEHGLQYQNLHKVLTGKRRIHLGWTL